MTAAPREVGASGGPLQRILNLLACPLCGSALAQAEPPRGSLRCEEAGHSFDLAKQGYVSFLGGGTSTATADTAAMVEARAAFLEAGHYAPLREAIAAAIPRGTAGLALDLAGGTGYYLAGVLDAHPELDGLGADLSAAAARRSAKAHPRAAAVTADAWARLPLADGSCTVVLSVFGPRNPAELLRVLSPGGSLIVVTPTPEHMIGLRCALGLIAIDPRKAERLQEQLAAFRIEESSTVDYVLELDHRAVENEILMGPNAHHSDPAALATAIAALPEPVRVGVSATVARYRRKEHPEVAGPG